MKPHLPIGQSDFSIIRERGDYFVDKSLFIQDIVDGADIVLVTRPRRYGKTLNMTMLRYFYGNDADYSDLFKGLKIMDAGKRYLTKMGKHPVVFMSFKDIKDDTWEDAYIGLESNIVESAIGFRKCYPLIREQLDVKEQEVLDRFAVGKLEYNDFEKLLKSICHALYLYHGHKAVILIDEYDTPVNSAWLDDYYDSCVKFMRDFLSGLKDNPWLEKAVLTGVVRISKESLFSGLNNLATWSVTVDKASNKFGFTHEEVRELLLAQGLNGTELSSVESWYNGYTFGTSEVYNPWSVLCYAEAPVDGFRAYWVNTSDNRLLRQLLFEGDGSVRDEIDLLIEGHWLTKEISEYLIYKDLKYKKEAVWNLLLAAGYLKCRNIVYDEVTKSYMGELAIPNKEVGYVFVTSIRDWVNGYMRSERFTDMVNYLANADLEGFEDMLYDFLTQVASVHDTAKRQTENFYHALFLGMLGHFSDRYTLKSNREAGRGRYDIAMFPRHKEDRGIVLEIKAPREQRQETLQNALDSAMEQLKKNAYAEELRTHGVQEILQLAIAVQGKNFLLGVV